MEKKRRKKEGENEKEEGKGLIGKEKHQGRGWRNGKKKGE